MRTFVFTNVDKDGLLGGPDLDEVCRVAAVVRGRFMYSGGIGRLEDLVALAGLRQVNLVGRDRRQGALRAQVHGRRGHRRARGLGRAVTTGRRARGARRAAAAVAVGTLDEA